MRTTTQTTNPGWEVVKRVLDEGIILARLPQRTLELTDFIFQPSPESDANFMIHFSTAQGEMEVEVRFLGSRRRFREMDCIRLVSANASRPTWEIGINGIKREDADTIPFPKFSCFWGVFDGEIRLTYLKVTVNDATLKYYPYSSKPREARGDPKIIAEFPESIEGLPQIAGRTIEWTINMDLLTRQLWNQSQIRKFIDAYRQTLHG